MPHRFGRVKVAAYVIVFAAVAAGLILFGLGISAGLHGVPARMNPGKVYVSPSPWFTCGSVFRPRVPIVVFMEAPKHYAVQDCRITRYGQAMSVIMDLLIGGVCVTCSAVALLFVGRMQCPTRIVHETAD